MWSKKRAINDALQGKTIQDVDLQHKEATLTFTDGSSAKFYLVICSDLQVRLQGAEITVDLGKF